jgi:hypothetical protein
MDVWNIKDIVEWDEVVACAPNCQQLSEEKMEIMAVHIKQLGCCVIMGEGGYEWHFCPVLPEPFFPPPPPPPPCCSIA